MRSRQRGQHERQWQERIGVVAQQGEFERGRDHHHAFHRGALADEPVREQRHPESPVALPHQEHRRQRTSGPREGEAHEISQRVGVLLDAEEGFVRLLGPRGAAAVACGHGIDEHQVREVEPGVGVVRQRDRLQGCGAVGREVDGARPHGAQVQERGGRAGPAIEDERDRAIAGLLV